MDTKGAGKGGLRGRVWRWLN